MNKYLIKIAENLEEEEKPSRLPLGLATGGALVGGGVGAKLNSMATNVSLGNYKSFLKDKKLTLKDHIINRNNYKENKNIFDNWFTPEKNNEVAKLLRENAKNHEILTTMESDHLVENSLHEGDKRHLNFLKQLHEQQKLHVYANEEMNNKAEFVKSYKKSVDETKRTIDDLEYKVNTHEKMAPERERLIREIQSKHSNDKAKYYNLENKRAKASNNLRNYESKLGISKEELDYIKNKAFKNPSLNSSYYQKPATLKRAGKYIGIGAVGLGAAGYGLGKLLSKKPSQD